MQSLLAAGERLPCALAMSSPWLDMTCDNGSFIVNEDYDLMMRKDRMVGIAQAYLAGNCELTDPRCSPLLAPQGPEAFAMPPTLIHVRDPSPARTLARTLAHATDAHPCVRPKPWPDP